MPRPMPSTVNLVRRGVRQMALHPVELLQTVPKSLRYIDRLPGAANFPGTHLLSETAGLVGQALGATSRPETHARELKAPRTPLNGTDHRAPAVRVRLAAARGRQGGQERTSG